MLPCRWRLARLEGIDVDTSAHPGYSGESASIQKKSYIEIKKSGQTESAIIVYKRAVESSSRSDFSSESRTAIAADRSINWKKRISLYYRSKL
jgi:hypothetical protein